MNKELGNMTESWLIIIPARLKAQRLPNKPLQDLGGAPLIVRVAQNLAPLSQHGHQIVVATDDVNIVEKCLEYKITAIMTAAEHRSGTDRCWEVAQKYPQYRYILNAQGDEPFLSLTDVQHLMKVLEQTPHPTMATLAYLSHSEESYRSPHNVKVVCNQAQQALYFSRSPIPHDRHQSDLSHFVHLGIYAFERHTLEKFCSLPPSPLELRESLEQLRALDHGIPIYVVKAQHATHGIDTVEDLEKARAFFK